MAHLITGYAGVEHIQASDDGAFNTGIIGSGKYVFNTGNKFEYEIVSNNLIKIKDGDLMNQGRHMNIPAGDVEECVIENGLQGVSRHDLIVMRYQKDVETGIESASLVVVKGTSSTSPSDPSYVKGNIYDGEAVDDFPLYRVRLNGLNIEGVDCLFEITPSIETLKVELAGAQSELESVQEHLNSIGTVTSSGSSSVTSIESDTKTLINTLNIPEDGTYYIRAYIRWNATSGANSGTRRIAVFVGGDDTTPTYDLSAYENSDIEFVTSGTGFIQQVVNVLKLSKGSTVRLWAQQDSGVKISVAYGVLTIRKIA